MNDGKDEISLLIGRVALGDRMAFRLLYLRTNAKLFGTALRILKNRHEAEEVVQEVYVKIWQRAANFQQTGFSPISWLVAIARNQSLDILRARKPAAAQIEAALDISDPAPDPEASTLAGAQRGQIDDCLAKLEPDRADAVRGAYLDGYSYEELAGHFKVPLNTMRTWLRRSLIQLKDCLTS